jgi:hypothetical protein
MEIALFNGFGAEASNSLKTCEMINKVSELATVLPFSFGEITKGWK